MKNRPTNYQQQIESIQHAIEALQRASIGNSDPEERAQISRGLVALDTQFRQLRARSVAHLFRNSEEAL